MPKFKAAPYHNNNKSFIKSKDGTLYAIGHEIEKGFILKQGRDKSTFYKTFTCTLVEKHNRLISPGVASSYYDPCFWLTYGRSNLIRLNKQTSTMYPPSRFGIGHNPKISCMLLDRDERSVWVGYGSAGIVRFNGDSVHRITINDGIVSDRINAIARDSSKNLWFASSGGVAVLRNSAVQKFIFCNSSLCNHNTKLTKYTRDRYGKALGNCYALFVDNSGMVWTHSDSGIARFDGSSWKLFNSAAVSPDLPYTPFSHIIQDRSGTIWFGTEGSYGAQGCGLLAYSMLFIR